MQKDEQKRKRKRRSGILNIVFFGLVLFFLLNTSAKSWMLKQVIKTGLFSAKFEQKSASDSSSVLAMPLTYVDESGKFASTENMRNKIVFINFWASWCPPCRAEMPSMNKMYEQLKSNPNYAFVFINLDEKTDVGKSYLEKNNLTIPLQRAKGFVPTDIYSGSLPTTVVLDKQGRIVMKHTGMADYDSKKFLNQLKELE